MASREDANQRWFIRGVTRDPDNHYKSKFRVGGPAFVPSNKSKTFHFFSRLPPELRNRIWKYALPAGRLVRIFYTEIHYPSGTYSNDDLGLTTFTSNAPIPAMLHACAESRQVASKVYKLRLGTAQSPATIYLDLSVDTLYFGSFTDKKRIFIARTLVNTFAEEDFQQIRHIAVQYKTFWRYFCNNMHGIADFVGIKTLQLVLERNSKSETNDMILVHPDWTPEPHWARYGEEDNNSFSATQLADLEVGATYEYDSDWKRASWEADEILYEICDDCPALKPLLPDIKIMLALKKVDG
ncbi:hypothetical protein ONS95_009494 [Cadophora gregata]|uniref:uncharacterized protein n=1 Tax=Cadophora gregata TaxID=51156 RepID=UPI0026DC85DB|nr:uncharacterized protein ONS95_009494 [Cadophora gregata]KAK0124546.1 hypothetical protein ONS95_009494 [Cadophora gregata]KAK0129601.1 hypothetical protein ONS96_000167 [Cadophora gregata f. sp. sojae]